MFSNFAVTRDKIRQEGYNEGVEKGREETVILALMEGADVNFVSKITKLPIEKVLEIKAKIG